MSESVEKPLLTGAKKASILLKILAEDAAAAIFRNLPEDDLQRVTREILNLGSVPAHVTMQVIREYRQMTEARDYLAEGGQATANRLLVKAFGDNGAKSLPWYLVILNPSKQPPYSHIFPGRLARNPCGGWRIFVSSLLLSPSGSPMRYIDASVLQEISTSERIPASRMWRR